MQYDVNALEFDKILKQTSKFAQTNYGKEIITSTQVIYNKEKIKTLLDISFEAREILIKIGEPPMGGITNIFDIIKRVEVGGVLNTEEIIQIQNTLNATSNNIAFKANVESFEEEYLNLIEVFNGLERTPKLTATINSTIDPNGEIFDNATKALSKIRKTIKDKTLQIKNTLEGILKSESKKLVSSIITKRNNRFCVLVRNEYKNTFKGILHDQSASKESVYIEPLAVSNINNELQELFAKEKKEIYEILKTITEEVFQFKEILLDNFKILSNIDAYFAKAKYANSLNCVLPIISDGNINLINARHPLINPKQIVKNTITLNSESFVMIITGPNTGGKTITLKTIGLLSLMVQSGFLIPVDILSEICLFDNIFADIGDEQSIEQSLSTFSSHMTKVVNILKKATNNSLVLLDELGSGTDPIEGVNLAESILEFLRKKSIYTLATTHYSNLKAYAYKHVETINASVEFDVITLMPTYKLLIGIPGKSNALLISERLGLNSSIIKYAKNKSDLDKSDVSDFINKLEKKSYEYNELIDKYNELIKTYKNKLDDLAKDKQKLEEEKLDFVIKKNDEKNRLLKEAKLEAENIIEELKLLKSTSYKEHELAELKFKTKNLIKQEIVYESADNKELKLNDKVKVISYGRTGIITKILNNKKYEVLMGSLVSIFKRGDLVYVGTDTSVLESHVYKDVKRQVKTTLDLRGVRYNEAMIQLDQYIDDCLLTRIPFATIIHGFGTGAIRKGVKKFLDSNKQIKEHRDGGEGEGGNGVTVIKF